MSKIVSEFELERSPVELLRNSAEDAENQLHRARHRVERAQRRMKNLENCVGSWTLLLSQYEGSLERSGSTLDVLARPARHSPVLSSAGDPTGEGGGIDADRIRDRVRP